MSLRALIVPHITSRLLSEERMKAIRTRAERTRTAQGKPHIVEFFHDPTDPYSQLLQSILPTLEDRYDIQLITHIVSPPDDGAAPERQKLADYARKDAERLAHKAKINFTYTPQAPASDTDPGDGRLRQLGHYLGGMLYYGQEWYWGLDRLHYLEARLAELGVGPTEPPIYAPPSVPTGTGKTGAELQWYLSFRSPYTAIVRDRVKTLAEAYGATLKLRFVLPMVMRGLPVPKAKKRYIPLDTAREARRLGVRFGRVLDPVGTPVEMGYSLLPWAREMGRGYEYVQSWLSGVWADGVDAGSPKGLQKIVEQAGLNWPDARPHLGNETWRAEAEANRAEMMGYGIWGVPSFRVGDTITWGQDRLWVTEDALKTLSNSHKGKDNA
jgi:2-hydroxychromene-2-carboxylate isomerase